MMFKAIIRVTGQVQGVGFRFWVKRHADAVGITGLVSNEPDGAVHIEAFGPRETLERFSDVVRRGSPTARVEHVEVEYADAAGGEIPEEFEIR